jgi:adenylate cyclase
MAEVQSSDTVVSIVVSDTVAIDRFTELLHTRWAHPEQAQPIDTEICDRFSQTQAVMVLDMVGFSRKTQRQGIIPALAEIYHLRAVAIPHLEAKGGHVFKADADNLYATFPQVDVAIAATHHLLNALNALDLHVSIGIGYGEMLVIEAVNVYGHEMNLASKLGEDIAADDEILLTEAAYQALTPGTWELHPLKREVSGLVLTFYRLQRSHHSNPA